MFFLELLAALELEDNDLLSTPMLEDRSGYLGAADQRSSSLESGVASRSQYLAKFNRISCILVCQRRHAHDVSGLYPELLSAAANDCICHYLNPPNRVSTQSWKL